MIYIKKRDCKIRFLCDISTLPAMDFNVLYCAPAGFPSAKPVPFREICKIVATLRGVTSRQGARVPGTPLTIRLFHLLNGARIELDYHGELAYVNFCCLEKLFADDIFELVKHFYQTYGFGKPWKPTDERWIHLIPVTGAMPDPDHSVLSQGLTIAFFWAACIQRQIRSEGN
jgi:hypothetical protein